jgi:hypothetical protein
MSVSNIKLLVLNVNRKGWHSGNMLYDMSALEKGCDTQFYGPGFDGYRSTDLREIISQLYGDGKPDIIYSYFTPHERVREVYQKHYSIPEHLMNFPDHMDKIHGVINVFAMSDFWSRKREQYSKDLGEAPFRYCVSCFTPPYTNPKDFYSFFDDQIRKRMKFLPLPRCVDRDCFKDYQLPKIHDVISVGAMWHFYAFRSHMHNYFAQHASGMGINYRNYPHCGTDFNHSDFVRENYAKAIHRARILIGCGGRYHVAYNKMFEAMGCATLYVGEKPYGEQELHFKDGYNYVSVTTSDFVDKIKYYLGHPNEMDAIVRQASQTFSEYHTIEARSRDVAACMKEIVSS